MKYRDMTEEQRAAWGLAECKARRDDLAADRTATGLKIAQERAERRRRAIGATRGQATDMVIRGHRAERAANERMQPLDAVLANAVDKLKGNA